EAAYGRYADMLYRLSLSHLGVVEDAEDAVHDVFEKYINTSPEFKDSEHEKAWFIRVTVNRCHDLLRKRSKRNHEAIEAAYDIAHEDSEEPEIFRIIHSLPEKHRAVIVLHYLEGYSVEETARLLKVTVSAVKMRLARGREQLKLKLEGANK
ncbi:MAG: RNA polymerase sigma factor, partial [Clostridia bacterium]|nr:RNA polymerase sigma factor [Clostridia bacterium]